MNKRNHQFISNARSGRHMVSYNQKKSTTRINLLLKSFPPSLPFLTPCLLRSSSLVGPALAHLDGLLPALGPLVGVLDIDLGLEESAALGVDLSQRLEVLPNAGGEASGNGGAESGGLAHKGTVDGDANKVGLGLL